MTRQERYLQNHPERRRASTRRYRQKNFGKILGKKYGITVEAFDALLVGQLGRCGCCGQPMTGYNEPMVDHDHVTGKVRGLLCCSCNLGIGKLGDTVEGVQAALSYLKSDNS